MHPLYHQGSVTVVLRLAKMRGASPSLTYRQLAEAEGAEWDKARRWALEAAADGLVSVLRKAKPGRGDEASFSLTDKGRAAAKEELARLSDLAKAHKVATRDGGNTP